jgi:hypothetical protein
MDNTQEEAKYSVRLLREKHFNKVRFKRGQIVTVKRNKSGTVYIMGYPSLVLGSNDYEMYVSESDYWSLLLRS